MVIYKMGKLKSVRRNTRRNKRTNVRRVKRTTVEGKKRHLRRKKTFKGGAGQLRKITITERNNYGNYAEVTYTWDKKPVKGPKPILEQGDWANIKEAVANLILKLNDSLLEQNSVNDILARLQPSNFDSVKLKF